MTKSEGRLKLEAEGPLDVWRKYEGDYMKIAEKYSMHYTSVYDTLRDYCKKKSLNYGAEVLRFPQKKHFIYQRKGVCHETFHRQ